MDSGTVHSNVFDAQQCTAQIEFDGVLGRAFVTFVMLRAARLDLRGWVAAGNDRVTVEVEGPAAMIDAFEIACSLGPIECDVVSWRRRDGEAQPRPTPQIFFEQSNSAGGMDGAFVGRTEKF